jgi:uncharacterized repeat protein (TIGR03803 family)
MSTAVQEAVSSFDIDARIRTIAVTAAILLAMAIIAAPAAEAQTLSILHAFTDGGDGGAPYAGLTTDQAGNFYGTTSSGGAGYGTVFKLTHLGSNWVLSTLYAFQGGNDGGYPIARVVRGPDGALYGTTSGGPNAGAGTVFRLGPPSHPCRSINCPWTETVLYRFTGTGDGGSPGYGDLAFDAAGNIYGTTRGGGADCSPYYNCGVVFELSRSGGIWTESVLYSFDQSGSGGIIPDAGVVLDSAGNLYGATALGGIDGGGVVFQLAQSGSTWTETVLHGFGASNDGDGPIGGLVMDRQGNLYGTTASGPGYENNGGTVYELQPSGDSWNYSILAALAGFGGPEDALTMDAAGNLYATSYGGGRRTYGNVFKLTPSGGSWTYTDLHDFNGDGAYPYGSVVVDTHGNVFGTTSAFGYGEVWEITP